MTEHPRSPPRLDAYRPSTDGPAHPGSPPRGRLAVAPRDARHDRRHDRSAQQPRRPLWARILVWMGIGGAAAAALVGALFAVLSPGEMIRDRLIAEVRSATGRSLTIDGAPAWSLLGGLSVTLGRTTVSQPTGMAGPPMLAADAIAVKVAPVALLGGRLVVDRIALVRPVLTLAVDADGRRSWDVAMSDVLPGRIRLAQAAGTGGAAQGATTTDAGRGALRDFVGSASRTSREAGALPANTLAMLDRFELGELSLASGTIHYRDARARREETIERLDLTLTGRDVRSPVRAKLALDWRGERIAAKARLDEPRALLAAGASKVAVEITSQSGTLSGDGALSVAGAPRFEGPVKISAASLDGLAALAGVTLPNARPLGALRGQGRLVADSGGVRLEEASVWLGELAASGTIGTASSGGRPMVVVDLALSALDLDAMSAGLREARSASPGSQTAPSGPPRSIDDLLRGSTAARDAPGAGRFSPQGGAQTPQPRAPQVRGYSRRLGWSEAALEPAALSSLDLKGRLTLGALTAGGIKAGATQLRVAMIGGVLNADIDDITLYEGRGRGRFTARADGRGVAVSGTLAVDGLLLGPLLRDAGGRGAVEGRARLNLAVEGGGASELAIMRSLAGRADLRVVDGAVTGWDISRIINGLGEGRLPSPTPEDGARTAFSALSATFAVKDGLATTTNIRVEGPAVSATGAGTLDIGGRAVDIVVHPRVSPKIVAPGSTINISQLQVPLRIRGPWERPEVALEAGKVRIEGQEQMGRRIKEEFRGKKPAEIVQDLLSKGANSESAAKARKLFKEFLKQ